MKRWWQGLAPRERILVSLATILTVLVVFSQFVLVPVREAHEAAQTDMQIAAQRLTVLQESYHAQSVGGFAPPQNIPLLSSDAFKAAVTQSATVKGLSISRLQSGNNDNVGIVFDNTDPRLVFFWLNDVEARLGGRIVRLSMEQSGQGAVRVNVEIEAPLS